MNSIDQFITTYNEYLFNKKRLFDNVSLIGKNPIRENGPREDIEYFIRGFTFPTEYNYSGFVFLQQEWKGADEFIHFASHVNYSLEYLLIKTSGSVVLYDPEYEEIEWYCSGSVRNFFLSMKVIIETKIKMQELETFDLDNSYLKEKYDECMAINSNEMRYSEFYEHLLGLE
ncbi:MAG: hypothetical protein AAFR61_12935 [Bacteroidota bacterium]